MDVTNNDSGSLEVQGGDFNNAPLWLPLAGTALAGTLLARPTDITVLDAEVTVTPDGANTADGTVTALVVGADAVAGVYNLTCTAEVANGGVFTLTDPDDVVVESGLTMTPGALGVTVLLAGPLQITITDGAADFDIDDTFALEVTSTDVTNDDGALVPFDPDGANDADIPNHVLTYAVTLGTENVVTVTADEGNTGDGTLAATIVDGETPELGPHLLTCNTAVANGGVFTLTDPYGVEIADDITLTVADLATTVFLEGGFRLAVTEGSVSFAEDDFFTIDVREFVATKGIRALKSGEVCRDRLLIHADGDDSNLTVAHLDELRSFDIASTRVSQLSALDNQ